MYQFAFVITTSVLSGLLIWFVKEYFNIKKEHDKIKEEKLKKEKDKQEARDDLLLGVVRVFLIDKMQAALDRGYTTQSEYEVTVELYKPYIKSGGNGTVKHLFEDRYNNLKVMP